MGLVKFGVSNFLPPLFSVKKIAVLSFLISLVFVLMFVGFSQDVFGHGNSHGRSPYRFEAEGPVANNPVWMKELRDSLLITAISIPGTHDTMAGTDSPNLGVITQSMNLEEQLESGIRALDIRVKHQGGNFPIFHANFFLGFFITDDVLTVTKNFLEDNPSETVIINLQQEHPDNHPNFDVNMNSTLANFADVIYNRKCLTELGINGTDTLAIPLGEINDGNDCNARGKLIIITSRWNEGFDSVYTVGQRGDLTSDGREQNFFSVQIGEIEDKWFKIKDHLKAAAGSDGTHLYTNFLSASGFLSSRL